MSLIHSPLYRLAFAALLALLALAPAASAQQEVDRAALIDDLVAANHILFRQGVLDGNGHVSVRDPSDPTHFLMSRALAPSRVTAADIMVYGMDGEPVDPRGRSVYTERFIHSEIYKVRPDVNSVIHSHSPTVIPFGVTQTPLRAVMHTASFLCEGAPVFEIRNAGGMTNMLVSTPALGKALATTLGNHAAALMRGHGDVVVGPTLYSAVARAIFTEVDARLELEAIAIGGPINYLAPEECTIIEASRAKSGLGSGFGRDRSWSMWKEEAENAARK